MLVVVLILLRDPRPGSGRWAGWSGKSTPSSSCGSLQCTRHPERRRRHDPRRHGAGLGAGALREQVSQTWWRRPLPEHLASTVLHAAYWATICSCSCPVAFRCCERDRFALRRSSYVVILTLLACYLVFMLLSGGRTVLRVRAARRLVPRQRPGPAGLRDAGLGQFLRRGVPVVTRGRHDRGHRRGMARDRRLGSRCSVPTVLLIVSVVYCQMHYGVDALTGHRGGDGGWWAGGEVPGVGGAAGQRGRNMRPERTRRGATTIGCPSLLADAAVPAVDSVFDGDHALHAHREVRQAVELVVARRRPGERDRVDARPAR